MKNLLLITIVLFVFAMLIALTSCTPPRIRHTPPAPDFAPLKAAQLTASTQASDTATKTHAVVAVLQSHASDTQPAKNVVAEVLPLAMSADQSAVATVEAVHAEAREVQPLEEGVAALHGVAVENEKTATHFHAAYVKESTSWFGGRIGRILWWGLWIAGGIGILFIVSQVLLSTVAPTGWINLIAIPIHIVGNIARIAWAMASTVGAWVRDWFIGFHVPWGQSLLAPLKKSPPEDSPPTAPVGGGGPSGFPPFSSWSQTSYTRPGGTSTVYTPPVATTPVVPFIATNLTVPILLASAGLSLALSLSN